MTAQASKQRYSPRGLASSTCKSGTGPAPCTGHAASDFDLWTLWFWSAPVRNVSPTPMMRDSMRGTSKRPPRHVMIVWALATILLAATSVAIVSRLLSTPELPDAAPSSPPALARLRATILQEGEEQQPHEQQPHTPASHFFKALPQHSEGAEASLTSEEALCYLNRYQDLRDMFGDNLALAKRHWVQHGRAQHRDASCSSFLIRFNKSFLKSENSAIYFVYGSNVHHVPACRPCGVTVNICDGSVTVHHVDAEELSAVLKGSFSNTPFQCEHMAPELWEGNNFVRNRKPLRLSIDPLLDVHINILMCGMGRDFTGGPLSIMHFANEMIKRGRKVRWINVDGEGLGKADFLAHATKYSDLEAFVKNVGFIYGARSSTTDPIPCSPKDIFMATIYFTAQVAHFTAKAYPDLLQKNFIYFIQDFEPIFFPHDSNFMEALESYRLPHFAIYSTPFLEDWFLQEKYGQPAYRAKGELSGISFASQPAMKKWPPMDVQSQMTEGRMRKVIVYTRSHADRNAYALTIDALSIAVCAGVFQGSWQFIGVGSLRDYKVYVGTHCGKPLLLDIRKNIPEPEYLNLLRTGDVGYSLMISPHPSLPPLDFASAGLISVTNSFKTKTAESFHRVSSNFVVVEPFIEDIIKGLEVAVKLSTNLTFRREGSAQFEWEHSWGGPKCYGSQLQDKIDNWLSMLQPLW